MIGPVTRSFLEFARPARSRGPRNGDPDVHRARHLFRGHCLAMPDPMVHESGWRRANHIVGRFRRGVGLSTIARLGRGVAFPRASRSLLSSSSGSGEAERPKGNLLVMPRIGINAPFTRPRPAPPERPSSLRPGSARTPWTIAIPLRRDLSRHRPIAAGAIAGIAATGGHEELGQKP
jgi:hypothetical protein